MSILQVNTINSFTPSLPVEIADDLNVKTGFILSGSEMKMGIIRPHSVQAGITLSGSVLVNGFGNVHINYGHLSSSFAKINTITPASSTTVILSGSITVSGSNSRRFKFGNVNIIPTSSVGLPTGTIYRTGSSFDEIKIVV